jgi:hypothetical protein
VNAVGNDVERLLHRKLDQWQLRREWYDRDRLLEQVAEAGGWEELLRRLLGPGNWDIHVNS